VLLFNFFDKTFTLIELTNYDVFVLSRLETAKRSLNFWNLLSYSNFIDVFPILHTVFNKSAWLLL